jgi:hypothetical protein
MGDWTIPNEIATTFAPVSLPALPALDPWDKQLFAGQRVRTLSARRNPGSPFLSRPGSDVLDAVTSPRAPETTLVAATAMIPAIG